MVFTIPDTTDSSKTKTVAKKLKCEEFYGADFVFFGTLSGSIPTMQLWANYKDQQQEKVRRAQQLIGEIPCLALRTIWRKKVNSLVLFGIKTIMSFAPRAGFMKMTEVYRSTGEVASPKASFALAHT